MPTEHHQRRRTICEVTTIGLAISAIAGGLSAAQTNATNKETKWGLQSDQDTQSKTAAELQKQIDGQTQDEMSERAKVGMRERASLRVAAGEAGVGGVGVDIQDSQSQFNQGQDIAKIESNRTAQAKQVALERSGSKASTQSKINSMPSSAATGARAGLQIADDQYSLYRKRNPDATTKKPAAKPAAPKKPD